MRLAGSRHEAADADDRQNLPLRRQQYRQAEDPRPLPGVNRASGGQLRNSALWPGGWPQTEPQRHPARWSG
ncbi:MAG: hypothetical protein HS126_00035 [Anaerolineales bacterium]|nr:hypothetical protein [Anaerolineales bacterium]